MVGCHGAEEMQAMCVVQGEVIETACRPFGQGHKTIPTHALLYIFNSRVAKATQWECTQVLGTVASSLTRASYLSQTSLRAARQIRNHADYKSIKHVTNKPSACDERSKSFPFVANDHFGAG